MSILTISQHSGHLSNLELIRNPKNLLLERRKRIKEKEGSLKAKIKLSKEDLLNIIRKRVLIKRA